MTHECVWDVCTSSVAGASDMVAQAPALSKCPDSMSYTEPMHCCGVDRLLLSLRQKIVFLRRVLEGGVSSHMGGSLSRLRRKVVF